MINKWINLKLSDKMNKNEQNLPNAVCKCLQMFYFTWTEKMKWLRVAVQLDPHRSWMSINWTRHHRIGRFQHRQLCFSIISRPSFVCINLARLSCFLKTFWFETSCLLEQVFCPRTTFSEVRIAKCFLIGIFPFPPTEWLERGLTSALLNSCQVWKHSNLKY